MKLLKGFTAAAAVTGLYLLQHLVISGAIMAACNVLGYWSYPAFFGLEMMLAGLVLVVLVPANRKGWLLTKYPKLEKYLTVDQSRLSKGIWAKALKAGPFALTLLVSLLAGGFFAALVIRFLGLPERIALKYAFLTTFIAVLVKISVYLGAVDVIRSFLADLFLV